MRRREFLGVLGSAAAAWPIAVDAQQSLPKWRVGYLAPSDPSSVAVTEYLAAFREGLAPVGLREFADAEILVSFAKNQIEKLPALAAELVEQGVKVIFAVAAPAVRAARQVTSSVPVVCIDLESDPITNGWASSLAIPGVT